MAPGPEAQERIQTALLDAKPGFLAAGKAGLWIGMTASPYPDRIVARPGFEKELAKRTLTNLYNQRPTWLDNAHKALDEAVAEAYGWGDDWRAGLLTEDEILARLFKLNQERAKIGADLTVEAKAAAITTLASSLVEAASATGHCSAAGAGATASTRR